MLDGHVGRTKTRGFRHAEDICGRSTQERRAAGTEIFAKDLYCRWVRRGYGIGSLECSSRNEGEERLIGRGTNQICGKENDMSATVAGWTCIGRRIWHASPVYLLFFFLSQTTVFVATQATGLNNLTKREREKSGVAAFYCVICFLVLYLALHLNCHPLYQVMFLSFFSLHFCFQVRVQLTQRCHV